MQADVERFPSYTVKSNKSKLWTKYSIFLSRNLTTKMVTKLQIICKSCVDVLHAHA